MKKRVGIIGFGVMGKNHYRVLKNIKECEVVGVCDPFIEENSIEERVFKSAKELLEMGNLDGVIVATPTPTHESISLECISYGVDMLLEKPISSSVESSMRILEAAKKSGIKCAIGHVERFNPVVETLREEIKNKEIYSISITRVGPFPPRIGDVGVLSDLSVHDIDLVRYVSGREFVDMKIFKSKKIHNHSEDNAELSFLLEDDIVGNITTNWLTPFKRRKIEIACKEAYYEADLMSQELMEYSSYQRNSSYLSRWCFVQKGEPLRRELEAFIGMLDNRGLLGLATFEDSIKTLEILERFDK